MERRTTSSPPFVEWHNLIEEALTLPGSLGNTYNRFYEYSFLNQVLLASQGVREPVATYRRWQEMGRQVLKGSKAKAILRPVAYTKKNDAGEDEAKVAGFKMVNCLFTVSETQGDDLPEYEPKSWDKRRALGALAIHQVPFEMQSGNVQGYSIDRTFAINPIAAYPLKTTFHELGHIVLSHTTPEGLAEYGQHRGIKEFQAESTAYLTMNEVGAADQMDAGESRAYLQHWLKDETPSNAAIKQVFGSVNEILRAGR